MNVWFKYLTAAYPRQRLDDPKNTAAVIGRAFDELELTQMERVETVKRAAERCEWWPTIKTLRDIGGEVSYERAPVENAGKRGRIEWFKRRPQFLQTEAELKEERLQMPVCADCGEHTPNVADCPFCRDIERMKAEEAAAV